MILVIGNHLLSLAAWSFEDCVCERVSERRRKKEREREREKGSERERERERKWDKVGQGEEMF